MKQFLGLLSAFFLLSSTISAQIFWTEDFGAGACNQGQLATDYAGTNGVWSLSQGAINGAQANTWYVSAQEQGGQGDGGCGVECSGDMNNTLHVSNIDLNIFGNIIDADLGAAFFTSTLNGAGGFDGTTDNRIESPTIDCTGKSDIDLNFIYLEGLNGTAGSDELNDNAEVWYFDGATWTFLDNPSKTPSDCAPQGTWTNYTIDLPVSANNNSNVKIGFRWTNNDDDQFLDPSFAVDDISLSEPEVVNIPIAIFGAIPDTICASEEIAMIDDQSTSTGTITTWTWDFDGGLADLTDPANPVNVSWTEVGEHIITLTVIDEFGTSTPYNDTITIEDCTPVTDFSISPIAICAGESISFTNNSTYQGPPPSVTWAWTFGNGNTSLDEDPADETYNTVGTFDVQLITTDDYGADTSIIELIVLDCSVPNAIFTVSDSTVCEDSEVTFTDASLSSTGATINDWQWTFPGGIPADFNGQSPGNITYNTAGTWTSSLVVTDANGVSTPYTQDITVTACQETNIVINVTDTIICIGECLSYSDGSIGENISEWNWSFEGGSIATSTQQNPGEICYETAGTFNTILSINDDNGITVDTISIYVNSAPTIELTASSTTICIGQTVTLVATGGGDIPSWSDGIVDGEPFSPTLGNHIYTGTITNDITGCSSSEDIIITVDNCIAPTALFGTNSNEICMGDCIDISDFSSNADTLFWDFGPDATPSSHIGVPQESIQVCFDSLGTYTITQTAVNEIGSDISTVEIIVHGLPTLIIPSDAYSVDFGNSVTINANSFDNVDYSWTPPQTLDNPFSQSPDATPEDETIYTVTIQDENNCTATGSVTVTVIYTIGLGIPSAFSPNAAAPNNTFGPLGYGFEVHRFIVFNRYGQKVFESQEAGQLWDGTMDGKRLNSGTFYWTLDYEIEGETRKTTSGQVSLIH